MIVYWNKHELSPPPILIFRPPFLITSMALSPVKNQKIPTKSMETHWRRHLQQQVRHYRLKTLLFIRDYRTRLFWKVGIEKGSIFETNYKINMARLLSICYTISYGVIITLKISIATIKSTYIRKQAVLLFLHAMQHHWWYLIVNVAEIH